MEKATNEKVLEALFGLQAEAERLEDEAEDRGELSPRAGGIREAIEAILDALGEEEA